MISRLNLYDLDGNQINLQTIGLFGLKLTIPSPSYSMETIRLDGGNMITLEKQLNSRSLVAEFMTVAESYDDLLIQKSELYALIGNGKEFYIEQTHRQGIVWKCHLEGWTPELIGTRVTTFSIPMTCLSGVSETNNLIHKNFTTTNFIFKNQGHRAIDPRNQSETEITFKGASSNLKITNETTGEEWTYSGTTLDSDLIMLKGIQSIKNGGSILGATNKKLITLAVGNNELTVSGASGEFELTISTRFYFL